jgi:ABC-type nitrate/sulfonate/bicarbonate transport system permease component
VRALASSVVARYWGLGLVVLAWDALVRWYGFNVIVLPDPLAVVKAVFTDWRVYGYNTAITLAVAVTGLVFGSVLGALLAVMGWVSRTIAGMVAPAALVVRSVPFIILIPIFSRLLGYNLTMVVLVVTLLSFFPSFVLVSSALSSLPAAAVDLGRVFGASRYRALVHVAMPAALPALFTSIRLSASRAVLGAMVAEFLTGIDGLGKLFLLARGDLESERAFAAAIVAALAAILLVSVAERLESSIQRRMT